MRRLDSVSEPKKNGRTFDRFQLLSPQRGCSGHSSRTINLLEAAIASVAVLRVRAAVPFRNSVALVA